jgi:hypothetical protein
VAARNAARAEEPGAAARSAADSRRVRRAFASERHICAYIPARQAHAPVRQLDRPEAEVALRHEAELVPGVMVRFEATAPARAMRGANRARDGPEHANEAELRCIRIVAPFVNSSIGPSDGTG